MHACKLKKNWSNFYLLKIENELSRYMAKLICLCQISPTRRFTCRAIYLPGNCTKDVSLLCGVALAFFEPVGRNLAWQASAPLVQQLTFPWVGRQVDPHEYETTKVRYIYVCNWLWCRVTLIAVNWKSLQDQLCWFLPDTRIVFLPPISVHFILP